MQPRTPSVALLAPLAGALALTACETDAALPALPDWSDGYEDAGGDDGGSDTGGAIDVPSDQTTIELAAPDIDDLGYETWIHESGTSADCAFEPPADYSGYQSVDCVLETEELDLFFNGLTFDFLVPEGACDYVAWHHYQYEAFEVGEGPAEVSFTVGVDGSISDEVNSSGGVPYCEYDYSDLADDYPNCCTGTYTVSVTYEQADGGEPVVETSSARGWGGDPAACYSGASYIDPEAVFAESGFPASRQVFTDQGSFGKRFDFDALSDTYNTNVNLANYYDPDDHDGGMPAGLTGDDAWPTYDFYCFDNAEEVIASLHLTVREWNLQDQFYEGGNPEVTGEEGNGSGSPIDDRADWAVATPGGDSWIWDAQ